MRGLEYAPGTVSPPRTSLRPARGGPETSSGVIDAPSGEGDRVAALQHPRSRPGRDAERVGLPRRRSGPAAGCSISA